MDIFHFIILYLWGNHGFALSVLAVLEPSPKACLVDLAPEAVSQASGTALSRQCLAGFQVCARGQVSPLVVLLTVSLCETWKVSLCRAREDGESGWSDGGLCPWSFELSS